MNISMQRLRVDGEERQVPGIDFEDAKQFLFSQSWLNNERCPKIEPIKEGDGD